MATDQLYRKEHIIQNTFDNIEVNYIEEKKTYDEVYVKKVQRKDD